MVFSATIGFCETSGIIKLGLLCVLDCPWTSSAHRASGKRAEGYSTNLQGLGKNGQESGVASRNLWVANILNLDEQQHLDLDTASRSTKRQVILEIFVGHGSFGPSSLHL